MTKYPQTIEELRELFPKLIWREYADITPSVPSGIFCGTLPGESGYNQKIDYANKDVLRTEYLEGSYWYIVDKLTYNDKPICDKFTSDFEEVKKFYKKITLFNFK